MSRVAVVTGGASGIGLGVARRFAADGHRVALARPRRRGGRGRGRRAARGGATVAGRRGRRRRPRRRSTPASTAVRAELGPVEILVTSAGIESFTPVLDITAEKWDRIIAVNLTGTFTCVQAALPDMLAAGWGRIVTISSSSAQSGAPNMAHYAASKGGVIGLTKALAVELARSGITVNTIPPSLVDTPMARKAEAAGDFPGVDVVGPMVPLGRAGTPGRHRRGLLVPLLRRRQLHHRPGHRRQRRHVHLTPSLGTTTWPPDPRGPTVVEDRGSGSVDAPQHG